MITGGSQGMGRGLAKLLAQKGANVVIVARNQQKLAEALKYISACHQPTLSHETVLTVPPVLSKEPADAKVSLDQCRCNETGGK